MNEITHETLLDQLHEQTREQARQTIMNFISGLAVHNVCGGFADDDMSPEGKNG
jgi:hypothetical protein